MPQLVQRELQGIAGTSAALTAGCPYRRHRVTGQSGCFPFIVGEAKTQETGCISHLRHTCTTLLTQNSEDVKVVQELLRHANNRVTLDLYAQAGMKEKREAQSKLVRLVLNKSEALA